MRTTLSQMVPGSKGTVVRVRGGGSIQRRIVDMGVVAGTTIEVVKLAPLADPVEVKVKGFNLSLRRAEAEFIEMEIETR